MNNEITIIDTLKPSRNMTKLDMFKQLTEKMAELYERKNHDYGDSFGKSYKEYGLTMVCIRLEDKLNRLKTINAAKVAKVTDEPILDTLIDLANYSIMGIIEVENERKEFKQSEPSRG